MRWLWLVVDFCATSAEHHARIRRLCLTILHFFWRTVTFFYQDHLCVAVHRWMWPIPP